MVKRYTRENCNYSFAELEPIVLAGLESVGLRTIQRLANRSRRWINPYINGLNDKQKEFVEQEKKSYRRDVGERLVDIAELSAVNQRKCNAMLGTSWHTLASTFQYPPTRFSKGLQAEFSGCCAAEAIARIVVSGPLRCRCCYLVSICSRYKRAHATSSYGA